MKSKFSLNTLVMIFAVVALIAVLTWIVPGGEYQRELKNGKTLVVPNSFRYISNEPQGIGALLISPIKGFIDGSHIIAFILIIGGVFSIIAKTGSINVSVQKLAFTLAEKPSLQKYFIPLTMLIFSVGGSLFGMCEETMPFILIFIPLALSLGYDSIVGTAIPFLGAAAGFAGSVFNPFTVGIAQGIAEVPLYSGMEYRMVIWFLSTFFMILFISIYAKKVKANPKLSPVYELDLEKKKNLKLDKIEKPSFQRTHKFVLFAFVAAMTGLVYGILKLGWYINEIAALFLALGIAAGLLGKLNLNEIAESFKEGAKDMIGVSLIIGCARAILIIALDGKILDTMLFGLSGIISHFHPIIAAQSMFIAQGIINFFVHSGSGQAALTMPVMAPLADVVGVSRQTAVLAFQFGEGWINPILPTSAVTMGVLGLAGIPYEKWFKWMLPMQIFFFILALLLLIPPFIFNYQ